jgi:hypothetical protein
VKPVAVCLLRASLSEFGRGAMDVGPQREEVDVGPQRPLASAFATGESLDDGVERLARALDAFREPPFTAQRLCELLLSPRDYYGSVDKLANAVEKLLTVTGMVPSLVSPPEAGDAMDVDENPAAVRARKDPLNVAQTAFVSSLVGAAGPAERPRQAAGAAAGAGHIGPSAAAGGGVAAAPVTDAGDGGAEGGGGGVLAAGVSGGGDGSLKAAGAGAGTAAPPVPLVEP